MFDPAISRMNAFSEEMLRFYLNTKYDASKPMGNIAVCEVDTALHGWLVGLHDEVKPIICRSTAWIEKAINLKEQFGSDPNAHFTKLYWAKALCGWLENGWNFEGDWGSARIFEESSWRNGSRPWPESEIIKYGLDDYMLFSYQAGEHEDSFEAGIEMYERWLGKKQVSLSKRLKPRDFAYALCLHRTARQQFDENDLLKAGKRMLDSNMQVGWLSGGQFIRAATWLKVVYWHFSEALTPYDVVLKAYDHMPDVERPEFIR